MVYSKKRYKDIPNSFPELIGETRFYTTLKEASKAAISLGITGVFDYLELSKKDPKLLSSPSLLKKYYPDYKGIKNFLGREYYKTWKEASISVKALGIQNAKQYYKEYKKDFKLHSAPDQFYKNFPGWYKFLGKN